MGIISEKKIYIYTLSDPVTEEVRYVGKTIQNPNNRYWSHISQSKLNRKKDHTHCWIRSLLNKELQPILSIIEETFSIEREKYWIKHYKELSNNITNNSEGGELGPIGATWKINPNKLICYKYKNNTPLLQYDKKGNFIRRWEVGKDFARYYNIGLSTVSACLKLKRLCNEFILIRDGEILDITTYRSRKKRIKITDLIINKEYIFNSATEAGKELKLNNSSLSYCARRKRKPLYNRYKVEYI